MNIPMKRLSAAILCGLAGGHLAQANPTGPQVVHGAATFANPNAQTLTVTNSANAIINWQGFSIGAGEATRFIQPSASSAVLNRVVGANPSALMGQLNSNGRVFLVNPHGIVFGPGASIDTAGFIASTLRISNEDFLRGNLHFAGDGAGSIVNQGQIRTSGGGEVVLIAPRVENSGLIQSDGGNLILAAGRSVTLTSLSLEGVHFEVQAPEDSVVNLGELISRGGAIGAFAGTVRNAGVVRANGIGIDAAGNVVLRAGSGGLDLDAGSLVSASGAAGGDIRLHSEGGDVRIEGTVEALGHGGRGGRIEITGDRVGLTNGATVDASGATGGGEVYIGGGFQGNDPDIANAHHTLIGFDANVHADALADGDGGTVIVWADGSTHAYGHITARGGDEGGDGGFIEVSGKDFLDFRADTDTGAPAGDAGTLLLDPSFLFVSSTRTFPQQVVSLDQVDEFDDVDAGYGGSTVDPALIEQANSNVFLRADQDITFEEEIFMQNNGVGLTAQAGGNITVGARIVTVSGRIELTANHPGGAGATGGTGSIFVLAPLDTTQLEDSAGADIVLTSNGDSLGGLLPTVLVDANLNAGNGQVSINGELIQVGSTPRILVAEESVAARNASLLLPAATNVAMLANGGFNVNGELTVAPGAQAVFNGGGPSSISQLTLRADPGQSFPGGRVEDNVGLTIGTLNWYDGSLGGVDTTTTVTTAMNVVPDPNASITPLPNRVLEREHTLDNQGTALITGDPGITVNGTLVNNGFMELRDNAELYTQVGTSELRNFGTLVKTGGANTRAIIDVRNGFNAGDVIIQSGSALVEGGYQQVAGRTILENGSVLDLNDVEGPGTLLLDGGTLEGNGLIVDGNVVNRGGRVGPGLSAGTLVLAPGEFDDASYFQDGGVLAIEIGSPEHDRLIVQHFFGDFRLEGGTVEVSLLPDFVPEVGQTFDVVQFPNRSQSLPGFDSLVTAQDGFVSPSVSVVTVPSESTQFGAVGVLQDTVFQIQVTDVNTTQAAPEVPDIPTLTNTDQVVSTQQQAGDVLAALDKPPPGAPTGTSPFPFLLEPDEQVCR